MGTLFLDKYSRILRSLSMAEQSELFLIKRKYTWILAKQLQGDPLREIEEEWILNRPHFISTNKIGIDLIDGQLVYLY